MYYNPVSGSVKRGGALLREVLRRDGRRIVHFADPPQLVVLDPNAVAAQGPEAIVVGLVRVVPVLLLLDAGVMGHDLADLVLRHAVVDHYLVVLVGEGPAPLDLGPLHAELGGQGFHLLDIPDAVGNDQEDERPHDGGDPFGGPGHEQSGDRQRRGVDDFRVLGHGELKQLVLEAGIRQERAEREGGHVPVHVVQLDPAQEVGARVHFDDDPRLIRAVVGAGKTEERKAPAPFGSVRRGRDEVVTVQPPDALEQLERGLGVGHLGKLPNHHLLVLGDVELDLVVVHEDLLERGRQVIPPELARPLDVDSAGRLERLGKTLDVRGLGEFSSEVGRLLVAGLDLPHQILHRVPGAGWRRQPGNPQRERGQGHAPREYAAGHSPSSTPTRLTSTSRRPSLDIAPTMPSCSIISIMRAARGYPMRSRRCRNEAEACPVPITTSLALSYISSRSPSSTDASSSTGNASSVKAGLPWALTNSTTLRRSPSGT